MGYARKDDATYDATGWWSRGRERAVSRGRLCSSTLISSGKKTEGIDATVYASSVTDVVV